MHQLPRLGMLMLAVLTVFAGRAGADVFTATVPEFAGAHMNYFDPGISAPVDFGQSFTTIDKVTVSITGIGHTGLGYMVVDPVLGGGTWIDIDAGLIASVRYADNSNSTFIGGVGSFTEVVSTPEATRFGSIASLIDGVADISLEFNHTLSFGTLSIWDYPYVDIQSVTVTVEGTSASLGASFGDPTGDGFVGIADLNLVLGGWNQSVTPGDVQGGDLDGDGFVGIADLNVVLGNWNAGTPPAQDVVIPEPMSIAVMLVLCGGALLCRRSRVQVAR